MNWFIILVKIVTTQLLLNSGADVNLCEKEGVSQLYKACQNGHKSNAQLLLNSGAGINLCQKEGLIDRLIG